MGGDDVEGDAFAGRITNVTGLWDDLRQSARSLSRAPGTTAVAVLVIAVGIGGTTAIFAVLDGLVLRPFPVVDTDGLVTIETRNERDGNVGRMSIPDYADLAAQDGVFSDVVAHAHMAFSLRVGERMERVSGDYVSPNYFEALGVKLLQGRGFGGNRAEDSRAVVLSYNLFRRGFAEGAAVVGSALQVNGQTLTVAGVAPPRFRGMAFGAAPDLFLVLDAMEEVTPVWFSAADFANRRDIRLFEVLGRLKPNVSFSTAEASVLELSHRLREAYPETNRDTSVALTAAREAWLPRASRGAVFSYLGTVSLVAGLVLVLSCSNVALLVLLRALRRSQEIAIRSALGASRFLLARQLLVESLLLYAFGFALSAAVAFWVVRGLRSSSLFAIEGQGVGLTIDAQVMLVAGALSLSTGIAFGSIPALRATTAALKTGVPRRAGKWLVVVQAALAVTLLVGGGLFTQTLVNFSRVDLGFRPDHLLLLSVDFQALRHQYDRTRGMGFYKDAVERIHTLPNVRSASWAADVPLRSRRLITRFSSDERAPETDADWNVLDCNIVGPRYLETLGIPLARGRDFVEDDREGRHEVAVVNETLARKYWPGLDALGRRFWVKGSTGLKSVEIIGVTKDVKQRALEAEARPYMYLALYQRYFPEMTLHVRTAGRPEEALPAIRSAIRNIDPDLPVFDAMSFEDQLALTLSRQRLGARVVGASAAFGLLIAVLGVYGVTAYATTMRARELGVRVALGATAGHIVSQVVREGSGPVALGALIGCAAAAGASRLTSGLLFGVAPTDPLTYAGSALVLVAVALLASYFPARRASSVDPKVSLRCD